MSFFASVDSTLTNLLRDLGTQVAGQCPHCGETVAAPIGARVRCVACQRDFTVASAARKFVDVFYETSETVADVAVNLISSTGLVATSAPAASNENLAVDQRLGGSSSSNEALQSRLYSPLQPPSTSISTSAPPTAPPIGPSISPSIAPAIASPLITRKPRQQGDSSLH